METICQEAKRLLQPIDTRLIIASMLTDDGRGCPEGWLNGLYAGESAPSTHRHPKLSIIQGVVRQHTGYFLSTAANSMSLKYPQPTPKERVMALLDDCINAGL